MRLLLVLALLLVPRGAVAEPPSDPQQLLLAVERHHRALVDLQARFVQTYRSGALGQELVERGLLQLKRPGRMRWEYRSPEKKLFVSDGHEVFFYVPADGQVIVQEQAGLQGLAFRLLAGDLQLTRDFGVELEGQGRASRRLRLVPRGADPEVRRLVLEVDPDHRIIGLEILDLQDNLSRFRFENLRENAGLPDRLFRFEIPKGVEVVRG